MLALGQGLKHVIDAGFASGDSASLNAALAGILAIAVVLSVATYARFYLMMSTGERVIADLRRAVFEHILTLSPAFFDATRTGEIDLAPHQRHLAAADGDRLRLLDVPAQRC